MDDDESDFEEFMLMAPPPPARRFQKADLLVIGALFVSGVCDAFACAATAAYNVAAQHANWKADQDEFRQAAALEIETLTNGEG